MKKTFTLLFVLFSLIVFTGCSKSYNKESKNINTKSSYSKYESNIGDTNPRLGYFKSITEEIPYSNEIKEITFFKNYKPKNFKFNLYEYKLVSCFLTDNYYFCDIDIRDKDISQETGKISDSLLSSIELYINNKSKYAEKAKPESITLYLKGKSYLVNKDDDINDLDLFKKNNSKITPFTIPGMKMVWNVYIVKLISLKKSFYYQENNNEPFYLLNNFYNSFKYITNQQYYEILKYNLSRNGNQLENPMRFAVPYNYTEAKKQSADYEDNLVIDENKKGYQGQDKIYSDYHAKEIPVFNTNPILKTNYLKLYYNEAGNPMYFHTEEDFEEIKSARIKNNIKYKSNYTNEDLDNLQDVEKVAYKYITFDNFKKILEKLKEQETIFKKNGTMFEYEIYEQYYENLDFNDVTALLNKLKNSDGKILDITFKEKLQFFSIEGNYYEFKEFVYRFKLITETNYKLDYIKTDNKTEYDIKSNNEVKAEIHNKSFFSIFCTGIPLTLWKVEFYTSKKQYDNNEPEQTSFIEGNNAIVQYIDKPGIYKIYLSSKLTSGDGLNGSPFSIQTKEIHFYDGNYTLNVQDITKDEELIGNELSINNLVFPNFITKIEIKYNENIIEYDNDDNKISPQLPKTNKYVFKKSGTYEVFMWDLSGKPKIKKFNFNLAQPVVNLFTVDNHNNNLQVKSIKDLYFFNSVVYFSWKASKPYKSKLYKKNNNDKFIAVQADDEFYQREEFITSEGHYKLETYIETDPNNKVIKEFIINKQVLDITFLSNETKNDDNLPQEITYQKNDIYRTKDFFFIKISKTYNYKFKLSIELINENTTYNGINLNMTDLKVINEYDNFKLKYNGTYRITLTNIFGNYITKEITLDKTSPKAEFKLDTKTNLNQKEKIRYLNYDVMYTNKDITVKPAKYSYISGTNIIIDENKKEKVEEHKLTNYFFKEGLYEIFITNDLGLTNTYYLYIRKYIPEKTIKIKNNIITHKKEANPKNPNEFEAVSNNPYLVNKNITLLWNNNDYLRKIEIYTKYISNFDNISTEDLNKLLYKTITKDELETNQFILDKENYYFIIYTDILGNKYKLYLEIDKTPIKLTPMGLNGNNKACSYVKFDWDEDEINYKAYYIRALNNKIIEKNERYYRKRNFSEPGEYLLTLIDRAGNITQYEFEISNDPIIYSLVDNDDNKYTGSEILTNKKLKLLINNPNYKYKVNGEIITSDYLFTNEITYQISIENEFGKKVEINLTIDLTPPLIKEYGLNNYKKSSHYVWFEIDDEDKAYLNGSLYLSNSKIKQDNKYLLEVYDKAGNITKLEFEVNHDIPDISIYEKNSNELFKKIRHNKPLYIKNEFQKLYVNNKLVTDTEFIFDKEGNYEIRVVYFFDMVADKTIRLKFKFSESIQTSLTKLKTNEPVYFNFDNQNVSAQLNNYEYFPNSEIKKANKYNLIFKDTYGNMQEYNFEIRYEFCEDVEENLGKNKKVNYPVKFIFNELISAKLDNVNYLSGTEIKSPGEHKLELKDEFGNIREYIFEQKFIFDVEIKNNLDGKSKLNKNVFFDFPDNITATLNNKTYYSKGLINKTGSYKLVLKDEFNNVKEYNFELSFELKEPTILNQITSKDNKITYDKLNFNKKNLILREAFKLDNIASDYKVLVNNKEYKANDIYSTEGEYKISVSDSFGNTKETNIRIAHIKPKKDKSYIRSNFAIGILTVIFTGLIITFIILFVKQRKGLAFKKSKAKSKNTSAELLDNNENILVQPNINPELEKNLEVLNDLEHIEGSDK